MTGTEVERVTRLGVAVRRRLRRRPGAVAPSRTRTRTASASARSTPATGEPRTIVCGAPNVAAGQTVAVALPGAVMPDGTKLGKAKLRGIESSGMILSETEMELGEDSSGIAVLDAGAEPGHAAGRGAADRRDRARARDHAQPARLPRHLRRRPRGARDHRRRAGAGPVGRPTPSRRATTTSPTTPRSRVEVPDLCPRFTARAFADVDDRALAAVAEGTPDRRRPAPDQQRRRHHQLRDAPDRAAAARLRPRPGPGRRDHRPRRRRGRADDDARRRRAAASTPRRSWSATASGPSGIAGIMGGQVSEVSDSTTRVLLEAANWNGTNILRTSNLLGAALGGVDPLREGPPPRPDDARRRRSPRGCWSSSAAPASCRARSTSTRAASSRAASTRATGARRRPARHGGPARRMRPSYLERLGLRASRPATAELDGRRSRPTATSTSTREVDLIEEVARVHGLDEHLPATLPERGAAARRARAPSAPAAPRGRGRRCAGAGVDEAITWSFVAPGRAARARARGSRPGPASTTRSRRRARRCGPSCSAACSRRPLTTSPGGPSASPCSSPAAPTCRSARPPRAASSAAASPASAPRRSGEPHRIGCVLCGPLRDASLARAPRRRRTSTTPRACSSSLRRASASRSPSSRRPAPFLHPARAAAVLLGGEPIGWVGELHPRLAAQHDLAADRPVAAFEIDAGPAPRGRAGRARDLRGRHHLPGGRRGHRGGAPIASAPPAEIRAVVAEAGGELLREARVFDVYEGEQVPEGQAQPGAAARVRARPTGR